MKLLSLEEKEAIGLVTENTEVQKAIMRLLDQLVLGREMDVVKFDLSNSPNIIESSQKLTLLKARAEGARSVVADFRRALESLKAAELAANTSKTE